MKIFNKSLIVTGLAVSLLLGFAGAITALAAGPAAVDLSSSANFVILSKTGITETGSHASIITGNIGASPITSTSMSGVFCSELTGKIYGVDAAYVGSGNQTCFAGNPPAANKTLVDNAVLDMGTAYADAAGRINPTATESGAGNIGGMTFAPGLYKWGTDVSMPTSVTLSGGANDVWIFQIAGNLNVASGGSVPAGIKVILAGGAQSSNIFWQVGGVTGATLGTYSTFNGNILSAKQVIMQTGAVLNGRALAQTQVTLDANNVSVPVVSAPIVPPVVPPVVPPAVVPTTATINVVKIVINDNGRTKTVADFPLFVSGTLVVSGVTNVFAVPASYTVTETADANYTRTFSGDCGVNGSVNLIPGDNKFCIITNNDIAEPASTVNTASAGGGSPAVLPVPPLIDVVKVPSPLALPAGPGPVAYTYTLRNIGTVPVTNITMVGDTCSPITLVSGDTNGNLNLDINETWIYTCSTTLVSTHTNTVTTTGWANGISAVDIASATVIVGVPVIPPLIHLTKFPRPLALPVGGGIVTYTARVTNPGTVALSNVHLTDNKCGITKYISGDINGNSKLDMTETWEYTCKMNLTETTTNTTIARGDANGLTARDYAISTFIVLTAAPGLPNTGIPPTSGNITSFGAAILFGVLVLFFVSLIVVLRKNKV